MDWNTEVENKPSKTLGLLKLNRGMRNVEYNRRPPVEHHAACVHTQYVILNWIPLQWCWHSFLSPLNACQWVVETSLLGLAFKESLLNNALSLHVPICNTASSYDVTEKSAWGDLQVTSDGPRNLRQTGQEWCVYLRVHNYIHTKLRQIKDSSWY